MKIEYLGHSCFKLINEKGISVLTDPYTRVGYELPHGLRADIVTVSHGHFDHNYVSAVENAAKILKTTEKVVYDGVTIEGIATWHDDKQGALRGENIIYKIHMDGLTVCHLGDLGEACREDLVAKIGAVDVLLLPIGGTYTINAVQAAEYVRKIQPKIAVPMHYLPQDGTLDIDGATPFLREFSQVAYANPKNVLTVSSQMVQQDKTQILFMER